MTQFKVATLASDVPQSLSHYSKRLQQLLMVRGITDADLVQQFLNPDYETQTHDPFLLNDMKVAVERIFEAVKNNEKIGIFSDYDCDGIPGAVILFDFFTAIGHANFINYIPHRHYDGFGLSVSAVKELAKKEVNLIITIDCGTVDFEAVEEANKLGIDVIITDHHEPKEKLPQAVAVVNPKISNTYPFDGLCGAAVVFKLTQALIEKGGFDISEGQEKWWLDMVGIATIADMVPLLDENRTLAHYGLTVLKKTRRPGLQKLFYKQKIQPQYLSEDDIGFTIGPRINAASRMDTPEDAFRLLTTKDESEAGQTLEHLEHLNNERKAAVGVMTKELHKRMKDMDVPDVIVTGDSSWRPSLVGLAANKLAEEYDRPVFLWGRDGNGVHKGSCRSNGKVSLINIMEATKDVFIEFGGHHASGGFSVIDEEIFSLSDKLVSAYQELGEAALVVEPIQVDLELSIEEIDRELLTAQKQISPFGTDNPKPVYLINNILPKEVVLFGKTKEHTKITFDTNGLVNEAIAFFKLPSDWSKEPKLGQKLSLLCHLEESYFMGRLQTRLRIIDVV